jgi:hypothetical protein
MSRPPASQGLYRQPLLTAAVFAVAALVLAPATAMAASITGIPVASLTSTSPVGLPIVSHDSTPDGITNSTAGWVRYYIPLENSRSGTYGVNGVGMSSDTGNGPGWLNMNLMFTPTAPQPLLSASLLFEFSDLDLRYVNDPVGFLETLRIYSKDGSYVEAITPQFSQATGTGSTGVFNGINYELSRSAGTAGASWPVKLNLWGDGLESIMTDPFWVQLRFSVPSGVPYGKNTPEYLRATLTTLSEYVPPPPPPPPHVVPEPASMLLMGLGLGAAALRKRKKGSSE